MRLRRGGFEQNDSNNSGGSGSELPLNRRMDSARSLVLIPAAPCRRAISPSAHSACSRTSGSASRLASSSAGTSSGAPTFPERHAHIAQQAPAFDPLDRRLAENAPEFLFAQAEQLDERSFASPPAPRTPFRATPAQTGSTGRRRGNRRTRKSGRRPMAAARRESTPSVQSSGRICIGARPGGTARRLPRSGRP